MKNSAIILLMLSTLTTQAAGFLGAQKSTHEFSGSAVKLETTQSYTFYNYGEPTVRFHESLDRVSFGTEDSMKLSVAMKSFYKTKTVGNTQVATLDTNFFGFVDDIIEIKCVDQTKCSISYNQELKEKFLVQDQFSPKYHAGINGTTVNAFNNTTVNDANDYVKGLQSRGSLSKVLAFNELSGKDVFNLNIESGALAGLLKEAKLCTKFIVHRCGTYCGRGSVRSRNPDTKTVGVCQIELQK
jgi:hypothetical protein